MIITYYINITIYTLRIYYLTFDIVQKLAIRLFKVMSKIIKVEIYSNSSTGHRASKRKKRACSPHFPFSRVRSRFSLVNGEEQHY